MQKNYGHLANFRPFACICKIMSPTPTPAKKRQLKKETLMRKMLYKQQTDREIQHKQTVTNQQTGRRKDGQVNWHTSK